MTGKDEESAPVPKIDEPKDSTRPHQDKSGAHTPTSIPAAAKRPHAQTSTDGVQTMTSGVEEPPAKTVQVRRSSLRSCLNVSVDKRSGNKEHLDHVQPDNRTMADSAALYSIIDNDVLISCVEIRPELWQPRHKDHKNRFKKAVLWSEVAAAVLPNVSGAEVIVQKCWKSLRDKFRKVTKVHKDSQKSGAGADDTEDSLPDNVWLHSDQLRFLKDTVEGRA
ncbi:hypothetical protein HPB49_017453 [Dermacentor silvarum]|uniref:Uncharacterized protein n=1 Tax=Dermacentor silvarum TaxID=543639 RepID=A0ACB8D6S7_DERSI|nr:hypothetical protein HPB49_017453 [Dermacentor silvarum]